MKQIGKIKMSEMKTLPFIAPYYKGKEVPRVSATMCKEFGGDCFKFIKKYMKVHWGNSFCETATSDCPVINHDGHVCSPEEITQSHYDTGRLYICPPAEKLIF